MMTTKWLPVVGWEGSYEVSDDGDVRSIDREVTDGNRTRTFRGRQLRAASTPRGHRYVTLSREGRTKTRLVHHLVLEAFVGPRPPGHEACHGNGLPEDNRRRNLRWDTRSSNVRDSVRHGTHNKLRHNRIPSPKGTAA
ncbi:NUMOD4 motif-containing HNH endonuclease [Mycolicibacterium neoaurum]|uniref:NUMOD4 motif-containing HNH endonuclease n=1 Tax=Mycolicibacterium neoaurum TaxID=1795 RepID=UPI003AB97B23